MNTTYWSQSKNRAIEFKYLATPHIENIISQIENGVHVQYPAGDPIVPALWKELHDRKHIKLETATQHVSGLKASNDLLITKNQEKSDTIHDLEAELKQALKALANVPTNDDKVRKLEVENDTLSTYFHEAIEDKRQLASEVEYLNAGWQNADNQIYEKDKELEALKQENENLRHEVKDLEIDITALGIDLDKALEDNEVLVNENHEFQIDWEHRHLIDNRNLETLRNVALAIIKRSGSVTVDAIRGAIEGNELNLGPLVTRSLPYVFSSRQFEKIGFVRSAHPGNKGRFVGVWRKASA